MKLGRWSWIGHGTKIRAHEGTVEIGAKTVLGQECTISSFQHVAIGRECIVADRVMLIDFDHGVVEVERPIRLQGIYKRDVDGGQQLLDRLRRLHPPRGHHRRQLHRRLELRRDEGRAGRHRRRRDAGAGAAQAAARRRSCGGGAPRAASTGSAYACSVDAGGQAQFGQGDVPSCRYSFAARRSCTDSGAFAGSPEPPIAFQVARENWYLPR